MKKLLFCCLILFSGCSLNENYVRQDRANFETLAPRIRKMMTTTTEYDESQKGDIEDRLQLWKARITQAEAALKEDDSE